MPLKCPLDGPMFHPRCIDLRDGCCKSEKGLCDAAEKKVSSIPNWDTETKKLYENEPFKAKKCPMLFGEIGELGIKQHQCVEIVTEEFFNRICNSSDFNSCVYYCRILKKLKSPMQWFQRKAQKEEIPDESN